MIITVFGSARDVTANEVAEALAFKFEVEAASLRLHRSGAEEFIVIVADEARMASNSGPHSSSVPFRVHCKWWTRQAHASAAVHPLLMNVELEGVPAHAWEVATAENLFNPYGWLKQIHSDTRRRLDYSAFKFTAWCFNPGEIPASRDLVIVEPPNLPVESPPVKRALVYPITIKATPVPPDPSSGSSGEDSDDSLSPARRW